ncbi:MAG TPA: laminin G, partial [bacterium]|nr:laminin G [bacterium]
MKIFTKKLKPNHLTGQLILPLLLGILFFISSNLSAQQLNIDRIEKMVNQPTPYQMRNWKQVTMGYDSLVFDLTKSGQFLPLIRIQSNNINYPNHDSFILHSYVGTYTAGGTEAINCLPAVVGATLVGIDKSNQEGYNWVLMCEEFFNNRPSENVYLNNPVTQSGNDWWYDTMPNVFFYQLYDLYPDIGDFDRQFISVADRWTEAVASMGGRTNPWQPAYMNYRAWSLSTMTPLTVGVKQPEAAGAIAWLLYHAYVQTNNDKYRIGAEQAMEFLNGWNKNPSYELQLPYGVYTAARMNAELGTNYDVEKLLNWCFDTKDNVRNWGTTLGNWGGYDCYGLIGEAKYAGYAFAMNGFEMAGALVPMLRYDERFARAIGKWMLNLANASRLFYSKYLPDNHQDNESWAQQYDPHSYIPYEAMRQYDIHSGISPYATGDAIRGGWSQTNFALYGGSHVGILGGIIDTTNVPMILQLDLNKTDYYQKNSYPSYLYFNPYDEDKIVEIDVGNISVDLYETVSNNFLNTAVSGIASIQIPANSAIIVVLTPTGGNVTYEFDKMLVDGVVVDYHSDAVVANYFPRIKSLAANDSIIVIGESATLYCSAQDRDHDQLLYFWTIQGNLYQTTEGQLNWTAPDSVGDYQISCVVDDQKGGTDSAQITIRVVEFINHSPNILELRGDLRRVDLGQSAQLVCRAVDIDGDSLSYFWSADYGVLVAEDSTAHWTAPNEQGFFYIRCRVEDGRSGVAVDSLGIVVMDSTNITMGVPIAFYPFNGNANDESGNDHHGIVMGALLTEDRMSNPESAYYFNGSFALIQVPNADQLNFQDGITVSFWMKVGEFFSRESYPISHGSWHHRWKVSIIPEKKIRWTVQTSTGIKDLDTQLILEKDIYYNVTCLYDGAQMKIFINSQLENSINFSGKMKTTDIDLTIGQELPNTNYNFKGVLDDIRLYNYAISDREIYNIFINKTDVQSTSPATLPEKFALSQNYPNPFNSRTTIRYQIPKPDRVSLNIYDILGKKVRTLVESNLSAGYHSAHW